MTIGIYGANGFIGRNLIARLAKDRMPTRAVSRRFDSANAVTDESVTHLVADFQDPLAMASSLQDVETVVQLISTSSPGLKNEHAIADIEENVIPHVSFLQNCINAGVKRYIFVSSGGTVYGPGVTVPTTEDAPTNPICSHGLTKLTIEKYIRMHGVVDGIQYVILRLANPFGPGQEFRKGQGLIPAIIGRMKAGQPIRIYGGGHARRDYVYIDDVVEVLSAAVRHEGELREVINVGSGESRSVLDVVETIESVMGVELDREWIEARTTDVDVSCLSIARARELFGWWPSTGFQAGIERTLNHTGLMRNHHLEPSA